MSVNERLHYLRKHVLHLNQSDFGRPLYFAQTTVSEIEKGKRSVTERTISAVCQHWKVREEWLRTGSGEIFIQSAPVSRAEYDEDFISFVSQIYCAMDSDERAAFRQACESCLK